MVSKQLILCSKVRQINKVEHEAQAQAIRLAMTIVMNLLKLGSSN